MKVIQTSTFVRMVFVILGTCMTH